MRARHIAQMSAQLVAIAPTRAAGLPLACSWHLVMDHALPYESLNSCPMQRGFLESMLTCAFDLLA